MPTRESSSSPRITPSAGRNLISGNFYGVCISNTTGNLVEGNYIGTDASGANPLANNFGVQLEGGGGNTVVGNVISGNGTGLISIDTSDNVFQGNLIGTDATGTNAVGNGTGVQLFDDINCTIGGTTAGAGNLISANFFRIDLETCDGTGFPGLQLEGNYIGTDVTGTEALGNAFGIVVGAPNVSIGGTTAGNVISGNLNNGVELDQGATDDLVQGNRIGTDVTGTVALGNDSVGIAISSSGNTIGGTTVDARNVICANQGAGVEIFTGSSNLVQGNLIGTDASGTVALGNFVGVIVSNLAGGNTIGGTMPGAGNVISGSQTTGVLLSSSGTVVQGNLIGTDMTGTQPLGNGGSGLSVTGSNNIIGGTISAAVNVISANGGDGIDISDAGNVVQGTSSAPTFLAPPPWATAGTALQSSTGPTTRSAA